MKIEDFAMIASQYLTFVFRAT